MSLGASVFWCRGTH